MQPQSTSHNKPYTQFLFNPEGCYFKKKTKKARLPHFNKKSYVVSQRLYLKVLIIFVDWYLDFKWEDNKEIIPC